MTVEPENLGPLPKYAIDELPPLPEIKRSSFTKEEFDYFVRGIRTDEDQGNKNVSQVIAQTLAGELSQDMPDYAGKKLFDYNSLRDGTALFFEYGSKTKNLAPEQRRLSDSQIIQLFAEDDQGRNIEPGSFLQGFGRDFIPQTLSLAGFIQGGRTGFSLNPMKHPVSLAVSSTIGAILGAGGMKYTGDELMNAIIGDEKIILPEHRASYEAGKSTAGAMAWLPLPFMISKDFSLNTANYMRYLNSRINGIGPTTGGATTPNSIKYTEAIERLITGVGTSARKNKLQTLAVESGATLGVGTGAYIAETEFPENALARVGFEAGLGFKFGLATQPVAALLTNLPGIKNTLRSIVSTVREKGIKESLNPLKMSRQNAAVQRLLNALEDAENAGGDTVENVIKALESDDLLTQLTDETGELIKLTAGTKTGNPTLLAVEAALDNLGGGLKGNRVSGAEKATQALKALIFALADTGDQRALQHVADLSESIFEAEITGEIGKATERVLNAFNQVNKNLSPETQGTNVELGEKIANMVVNGLLPNLRTKEKSLWNKISLNIPIGNFRDSKGDVSEIPNYIRVWNDLKADLPEELRKVLEKEMFTIDGFVRRTTKEMGLDEVATETAGLRPPEGLLAEAQAFQRAQVGDATEEIIFPTANNLVKMRGEALRLVRKYGEGREPDPNLKRIASAMERAFLQDLDNATVGLNFRQDYDNARAYSRALNDSFRRAFAGEMEYLSPELVAKKFLTGGNDVTYLRAKQLEDLANFTLNSAKNFGGDAIKDADDTIGTINQIQEQIIRNARALSFDETTGKVNINALNKYIKENEDLVKLFPKVFDDLKDAKTANILFDNTSAATKRRRATVNNQMSFYNVMNPKIDLQTGRRVGTESPTSAISLLMAGGNRFKTDDLNNLLKLVNAVEDPELRKSAMNGLKSSILEWATMFGGGTSRDTFSSTAMFEALYAPMKNVKEKQSLMNWMTSNGVIDKAETQRLETLLREMVRLERASAKGEIGELVEQTGPVLDYMTAMIGSAIGTRTQRIFTGGSAGPGSIVAAGKGVEAARNIFQEIPAALRVDVMSEIMENPKLLAAMLRKPSTKKEKIRIGKYVKQLLFNLGYVSGTRPTPTVIRELEEDLTEEKFDPSTLRDDTEEKIETSAVVPEPRVSPVQTPNPLLISQNLPQARPQPATASGPVDRTKYAALFPNDMASSMIKGGIGGLMG